MPFRLLTLENGYETIKYKALAGLFNQMRRPAEKTIANCSQSAHGATMSEKHDVYVRRFAGLGT